MTVEPRGIRNNNPGNIRHGADWNGLCPRQEDENFCQFSTPVWGLRAMAKILLTYQRRHKLMTVSGIIGRWAPPVENDTTSYVEHVAAQVGVDPDDFIDLASERGRFQSLLAAIIRHENGKQPYDEATINAAIDMALT